MKYSIAGLGKNLRIVFKGVLLSSLGASALGLTCWVAEPVPVSRAGWVPQEGAPSASIPNREGLQGEIRKYEGLVRTRPESSEIWSNLGAYRAMSGDCSNALLALKRAQSLNANLFTPWFFAGYCYFAIHQNPRAAESLDRALRLNPRDPNAWFLKAQVNSALGEPVVSLDALARSQVLGESRPEAYYLAGKVSLEMAANFYSRVMDSKPQPEFYAIFLDAQRNAAMGTWDAAIAEYLQASKISTGHPDLYFALGSAYLEKGDGAEAESSFRQCLEADHDSTWAKLRLTLSLIEQNKLEEAARVFQSVGPGDLEISAEYQDFISCAYLLDSLDEARMVLARARARFGNVAIWTEWSDRLNSPGASNGAQQASRYKLAGLSGVGLPLRFILTSKQNEDNVFEDLFSGPAAYHAFRSDFLSGRWFEATTKILPLVGSRSGPETPARAFGLGQILQSVSYGFYEQLSAVFPDSYPAMKLAADNFRAAGQPAQALEIYQNIIKKVGPSPDVLREEARIYWEDHKWDEALKVLEPLARMDPYDATIYVNLGRIYLYEGNLESGAEAFRSAVRIDPGMMEAHLGLGRVLRRKGELRGAVRELSAASRISPADPKPHFELSQIYSKLGNKALAAEEMASFQRLSSDARAGTQQQDDSMVPLD